MIAETGMAIKIHLSQSIDGCVFMIKCKFYTEPNCSVLPKLQALRALEWQIPQTCGTGECYSDSFLFTSDIIPVIDLEDK